MLPVALLILYLVVKIKSCNKYSPPPLGKHSDVHRSDHVKLSLFKGSYGWSNLKILLSSTLRPALLPFLRGLLEAGYHVKER